RRTGRHRPDARRRRAWRARCPEDGRIRAPRTRGELSAARTPRTLPTLERTLPRLLKRQAARYADKELLRSDAGTRSYAELCERAAAVAGALAADGVGRGDVVALLSENRLEMIELWLGCAWLGAVLAPLNTGLRGPALAHALRLSD